ncbi:hypothetical protein MAR_002046 [Mya arenaria]|uniref:Uncharacterized protein n=1 Tax=Mya arenaria TaxID=6604 RepID=A0ABY7FDH7_MYAAR|nr:uncharacterized protein LOC128210003 [Mya arenaria]WAR20208.1 hypothetical protein MAR_002046 [Mya arenaria]
MLTTSEPPDATSRKSAFHPVSPLAKTPPERHVCDRKRDSGYGSDFSPAYSGTPKRKFTFDESDDTSSLATEINVMNVNNKDSFDDVFFDHFDVIPEGEESDDTDKEVEELLSDSPDCRVLSNPIAIVRPPPPAPTPESDESSNSSAASVDCLIASPFYHTQWTKRDRVVCRNPFRPIVSRSVGTQTPSPHCQLIQDVLTSERIAASVPLTNRGHPVLRLRMGSDCERRSPLPDVVPSTALRDRSASLPDVGSLRRREHEKQVGRELRRISDDFHTLHSRRRERGLSMSFPLRAVDLQAYWTSLRRYVSNSPLFRGASPDQR